jgi:hypothetical protein
MRTPREKFLAHLQKTIKTSTSATERTAARKMYAEMTFGLTADGAETTDSIPLPEMPLTLEKRTPSEYDETVQHAMRESHAPRGLSCLLLLVKPPEWMLGLWGETVDGWVNKRDNDKLLSWAAAQAMVADRIAELHLDPDKVYAYPKSHCGWREEHILFHLPCEP